MGKGLLIGPHDSPVLVMAGMRPLGEVPKLFQKRVLSYTFLVEAVMSRLVGEVELQ